MFVILRSSRRPECLVCQQLGLVYVNLFPINLISLNRPIGLRARRITLKITTHSGAPERVNVTTATPTAKLLFRFRKGTLRSDSARSVRSLTPVLESRA